MPAPVCLTEARTDAGIKVPHFRFVLVTFVNFSYTPYINPYCQMHSESQMVIYDDIYHWKGWGGKLALASGSCRLRIFDQKRAGPKDTVLLRPVIVIVSDVPGNEMSVRSCASHIATMVTKDFGINPQRMLWIEYHPALVYGRKVIHTVPERYDSVEFTWKGDKAITPKWRPLKPPILDEVIRLVKDNESTAFG